MLLSIITLGIYTWWIPIKIKKWQIKHTHLLENDTPAEEQENICLTDEEIEELLVSTVDAMLKSK